jgi:hypothetical protein
LSFAKERIGTLAAIVATIFYLLALYLFALSNTPENPFASIYSETLIKTTSQHLLLLVGFDTLIYRKYYDTPPILVGHQPVLFINLESNNEDGNINAEQPRSADAKFARDMKTAMTRSLEPQGRGNDKATMMEGEAEGKDKGPLEVDSDDSDDIMY